MHAGIMAQNTWNCLFSFLAWFSSIEETVSNDLEYSFKKINYILHNGLHVWVPSGRSTIISVSSFREETISLKDAIATFDYQSWGQNIVILFKDKH